MLELTEADGEARSLYVDPASYLIVREVYGEGQTSPTGPSTATYDFEYLPPQPDNLALLKAPVPNGFLQAGVHQGPDLTVAQVQARPV